MKLSEIKGPRAVVVIAELIQPLANIAGDRENIGNLFRKNEDDDPARRVKENLPVLLKTHNADLREILGIINEENPDDLTVPEIVKGTLDLLGDDDFMSLFMSAVPKEARQQPTGSSGAAEGSEPA